MNDRPDTKVIHWGCSGLIRSTILGSARAVNQQWNYFRSTPTFVNPVHCLNFTDGQTDRRTDGHTHDILWGKMHILLFY